MSSACVSRGVLVIKKCAISLVFLGCAALCGCYTYNAKAYDLSGKMIYEGTIRETWTSGWVNEQGKRVRFYNSTIVLEEI